MSRRLEIPLNERRGLSRTEAAGYVGVSPSKFDQLLADGRMPGPVPLDGRRIYDRRKLDEAFDALSGEAVCVQDESQDEWGDTLR